jgi:crotonobetainyl-CoA:carnitine CoA-transferase CaiB-like acyl-CoA transferase
VRISIVGLALLLLSACGSESGSRTGELNGPNPCEARSQAICDAYTTCNGWSYAEQTDCEAFWTGFCETAVTPPDEAQAAACAEAIDSTDACETFPGACEVR